MITIKSKEEIEKLKVGGRILAGILQETKRYILDNYKKGGLTTNKVDEQVGVFLKSRGVQCAFKGYRPDDDRIPFPGNLCISINDEVVHGICSDRIFKNGDLVSIDLEIIYKDLYTDAAISFVLGKGAEKDKKLIRVARESLYEGIKQAKVGNNMGDISAAIEKCIKKNSFGIVRNYCGHGVGYAVHEDPSIPNYGKVGEGEEIKEGMVFAIEPMVVAGREKTIVDRNNWTVKTADGGRAAHWEHTVAVAKKGPVIITKL